MENEDLNHLDPTQGFQNELKELQEQLAISRKQYYDLKSKIRSIIENIIGFNDKTTNTVLRQIYDLVK